MSDLTLSVAQLNGYVKRIIDAEELLWNISVYGEISNFKLSGLNAYFDIKEEEAQLSCVIFGCKTSFRNGDKVVVSGRLNYHIKLGKLSFIASKIEKMGVGELYEKFLKLKQKLTTEGLFDDKLKKAIPVVSNRIGIITSETGAVLHDIYNIARRKNPFVDLFVYPVRVQGDDSVCQIIEALNFFEKFDIDVVIVARGGGSIEDLQPFNDEKLVRAIFACKKPIVSAVGHETDFTLTDFVSDLRASTPSMASELAVFDFYEQKNNIFDLLTECSQGVMRKCSIEKDKIISLLQIVSKDMTNLLINKKSDLNILLMQNKSVMDSFVQTKQTELDMLNLKLDKMSPLNLLKNGYLQMTKDGRIISSLDAVDTGDMVDIRLVDGKIVAKVEKKEMTTYGKKI